jgi:hypothetical protein
MEKVLGKKRKIEKKVINIVVMMMIVRMKRILKITPKVLVYQKMLLKIKVIPDTSVRM